MTGVHTLFKKHCSILSYDQYFRGIRNFGKIVHEPPWLVHIAQAQSTHEKRNFGNQGAWELRFSDKIYKVGSMETMHVKEHILPKSCVGTARKLASVHFGPESSKKKAYIQAGLHADEPPGYLVAVELIKLLNAADKAGQVQEKIVVVPVANPIGLSQWGTDTVQGRFDNSDLVNFNRAYDYPVHEIAALIDGKLSSSGEENIRLIRETRASILSLRKPETETQYLKNLLLVLAHDADVVLDLHCDHQAELHIYMGSPLWPEGKDLSAQMGACATLVTEDSGAIPFDEASSKIWWELQDKFPDYPIPAACFGATVELRGVLDTRLDQSQDDAKNIFTFLMRRGFIAGEPPDLPALKADATPLECVDYITTARAGILSFVKEPGQHVREGEVVAVVVDPLTQIQGKGGVESIVSRTSGVFFARCVDRYARPGKIIGKVAGSKPLMERGSYLLTF